MSNVKFLIDTNIFISLENTVTPVPPSHALFHKKCSEKLIQLCLHEASKEDISKDKEILRKINSFSKIQKYVPLENLPTPSKEELETLYGPINSDNDYIDCKIFYAVDKLNAANFLITEDIRLRKRAHNHNVGNIILSIEQAIDWIENAFEPIPIPLPQIIEKQCHQLPITSPIYESLQQDYNGFMDWFSVCRREHRNAWIIEKEGHPSAIMILKEEPKHESHALIASRGEKILKVCTFKVSESVRGEKVGELYLKKLFWYAHLNNFDLVYLTVFEKHVELIVLLDSFGFEVIGRKDTNELIMCKKMCPDPMFQGTPGDYHFLYYPNFREDEAIRKFIVPIRPEFSVRLFPEKVMDRQPLFFEEHPSSGNVIRKVYISNSRIKRIRPGDILLFYNSKNTEFLCSQEIISLGIAESVSVVTTKEELIRKTAKRTVYTEQDLDSFIALKKPLTVISFSLAKHIEGSLDLDFLMDVGVLKGPPQTILEIGHSSYQMIKQFSS